MACRSGSIHPPRFPHFPYPTLFRSPIATQDLYLLIDQLRQQGTSVILCSHVLPGVEAHINRAAILAGGQNRRPRSEEHTSELQSRPHLVCRLLLEKKNLGSLITSFL